MSDDEDGNGSGARGEDGNGGDGATGGNGGGGATGDDENAGGGSGGSDGSDGSPLAGVDEAMRERFTWYVAAKKEFADAVRSRLLLGLSVVFVIVFALPLFLGVAFGFSGGISQFTTDQFFQQRAFLASGLIPIIAIVVGYASISGERESGSLKVLLSLPFTRRDVFVGKVLGRSAVVAIPILIGFLVSAVILLAAGAQLKPVGFLLGSLLAALLGVVFVALAVGFSAGTATSRRAIVGTVGVYVYFFLFWNTFAQAVGSLLREYLGAGVASTLKLSLFLKLLNPTQAYQTLVNAALGQPAITARAGMFSGRLQVATVCQRALGGNVSMSQAGISCNPANGGVPLYFSDAAVLLYLLAWLVVPLYLGYRLFDGADL